jgi:hypothetical protein
MAVPPSFAIVCDHGNRGGHLDGVAWLSWFADRRQWMFLSGDGLNEAVELFDMDGNRRVDWQPMRSMWEPSYGSEEPTRTAFEIRCCEPRCSRRPYRSDTGRLQVLLDLIASNAQFRDVVAASVTDGEHAEPATVFLTLDSLHLARDTARSHFHMKA